VSAELLVRKRWSMDNLSVIKKQSCLQVKCFGSGVYRGGEGRVNTNCVQFSSRGKEFPPGKKPPLINVYGSCVIYRCRL